MDRPGPRHPVIVSSRELNLVVVRRLALRDLRDDFDRLAGGQHAVHAGGADADSLLAPAHPQAMEFGTVEQLPKISGICFLRMPGPLSCTPTLKHPGVVGWMWTQISGRIPASSQASSELSTASLIVVSRALRDCRNRAGGGSWQKLAHRDIARLAAIDSAVARRRDDRRACPLVWCGSGGVSISVKAGSSTAASAAVLELAWLVFLVIRQPFERKTAKKSALTGSLANRFHPPLPNSAPAG